MPPGFGSVVHRRCSPLALEPVEAGLTDRQLARPGESIFARGIGRDILRVGVIFALIVIALMVWSYRTQGPDEPWKTMVFPPSAWPTWARPSRPAATAP